MGILNSVNVIIDKINENKESIDVIKLTVNQLRKELNETNVEYYGKEVKLKDAIKETWSMSAIKDSVMEALKKRNE